MNGTVQYGTADVLGIRDGYLGFVFENAGYKNLPEDIKSKFEVFIFDTFFSSAR